MSNKRWIVLSERPKLRPVMPRWCQLTDVNRDDRRVLQSTRYQPPVMEILMDPEGMAALIALSEKELTAVAKVAREGIVAHKAAVALFYKRVMRKHKGVEDEP